MTTPTAEDDQVADARAAGAGGEGTTEAAVMLLAGAAPGWIAKTSSADSSPVATAATAPHRPASTGEPPSPPSTQANCRAPAGSSGSYACLAAGTPVSLSDALPRAGERGAAVTVTAIAHAAGQTWLSDGGLGEHADLLTTLDNFLRSSPKVTDALAAFMAGHRLHVGSRACEPRVRRQPAPRRGVVRRAVGPAERAGRDCGGPVQAAWLPRRWSRGQIMALGLGQVIAHRGGLQRQGRQYHDPVQSRCAS